MKYIQTPNYILTEHKGGFYIKVRAEERWRDCVGDPELVDADLAAKLEEGLRREEAAEWIRKAAKASPDLADKLG